ncbi:MAG: alkaline phosphatase [Betaproteobacteria bacterium]
MQHHQLALGVRTVVLGLALTAATQAFSAPSVSRLTPPSELFSSQATTPIISRFLVGQRFDLQATVRPDAGQNITSVNFLVDGVAIGGAITLTTAGLVAGLPVGTAVASRRAYTNINPGIHILTATARQSDGQTISAQGNFEVLAATQSGRRVKNVIIMLGDGMGAAHRTAARLMLHGVVQGKPRGHLAMDTFPFTGMVMTSSLNSIVTDSSPGMASYVTGNKHANNQEGVFPDDTVDPFDNPRVEYLSQYLHRTQGTSLGIVTTADVFDATPAANAIYTSNRGAGTGIVDQYLDDRNLTGLKVLLGGGRKRFLPNLANSTTPQPINGSQRRSSSDYVLPADVVSAWGSAPGAIDPGRDLINDFMSSGWRYVSNNAELSSVSSADETVLGLFALSNMNVAFDKIGKRRGDSSIVDDYGFPDQPMLDDMARKALEVLRKNSNGFVLMVEGASIDKQAHNMDSERWMIDTIEFDRAIQVAKDFATQNPDTLVIITADHECAGAAIIGGSKVSNADLLTRATSGAGTAAGGPRNGVVGTYDAAGFPKYTIAADGYPVTTDIDKRMLIGYGANADRYEDWLTNAVPLQDSQQPFVGSSPLNTYPATPLDRDTAGGFLVTGQVQDATAAHTASDIPLSAYGRGASLFTGVMDNSDVFFKIMQAVLGGAR